MTQIIIFPNHSNPANPILEHEIHKKFSGVKISTIEEFINKKLIKDVIVVAPYGQNPNMNELILSHYISTVAKLDDKNTIFITDYYLDDILDNIDKALTKKEGKKNTTVTKIDKIFYPKHSSQKRFLDPSFLHLHHFSEGTHENPNEIDLTGRSRLILSLSQFTLPKGEWTISIIYDLDEAATQHRLQFEWGSLHKYKAHSPKIGRSGRFETKLQCEIDEVQNVEFRVALMTPAFSGRMKISEVYLERIE